MRKIILLAYLLTIVSVSSAKSAFMGLAIEATMPFVDVENPDRGAKVKQGILKNLGDALAAETGFKIEMIPLPMKRMGPELISGNISFICYTLEAWLPSVKEQVLWSDVIFNNQNLLVSLGAKPIKSLKDLDKKRVGVVVNFYYPNLEDSFNKYQIFREHGPNNESNLQKLLHGRVDYVVLSSLEYQYQKKLQPRLNAYDLGIDTFGVKCAVSKKSPLSVSKINQAIAAMKKSGKLDRIFRLP